MYQKIQNSDFPAKVTKLSNGLTMIHQELTVSPIIAVDIWVKAGAKIEPFEWSGIAHFLEHLIFKGSEEIGPGVFDQMIENEGGIVNAATSHDYAHFYIITPKEAITKILSALADILLFANMSETEFIRERDVILEEIRVSYDNPDIVAFETLISSLFQYHPYGRTILGTPKDILSRSPEQLITFHHHHYQPENITIAIVGDISYDQARKLVEDNFTYYPNRLHCPKAIIEAEPPLTEIRRSELYLPQIEQARLLIGWIGPGVDQLPEAYGLDLLSALLGGGRTARLVDELRENRQLVQYISSDFSLQQDSSIFTISAWLAPENLQRVEAIIGDQISRLQTTPISQIELNKIKQILCNNYHFYMETCSQIAGVYGYYNTIAQAELATCYIDKITAIQAEDLQQIANQYLSPYRYAVTVLKSC